MIDEIIVVKLITHDQFIGLLKEEDDGGIRLENPMRLEIIYRQNNTTKPDVIVMPWDELSKMNDVYFDKGHILYYTLPKEEILEFYKKQLKIDSGEEDYTFDKDILKAMLEKMTSNTGLH